MAAIFCTLQVRQVTSNRTLSRGSHFVLEDLKSFVYARLALFYLRG